MKYLIFSLCTIAMILSALHAEENRFYRASKDIQLVYEHFEGKSLKSAIDDLTESEHGGSKYNEDDIIVRFNGGGFNNRLYIGQENTLEILVKNQHYLDALSLGFELTCDACPDGEFDWVSGYGTITPHLSPFGISDVIKIYPEAFGNPYIWHDLSKWWHYPDSLLFGAMTNHPSGPLYESTLPPHDTAVLLYSMQIELPEGTLAQVGGFKIDNVFLPPAGIWAFIDSLSPEFPYPPNFDGVENSAINTTDAPPVYFDVVNDPICSWESQKDRNDGVIAAKPDGIKRTIDYNHLAGISENNKYKKILLGVMKFNGDEKELIDLAVRIYHSGSAGAPIYVEFPLAILPRVCQIAGVEYIEFQGKGGLMLNYSSQDIYCNYQYLQDTLSVSGESVILGIIGTGIDWLHGDFRDSEGNTRIPYDWEEGSA